MTRNQIPFAWWISRFAALLMIAFVVLPASAQRGRTGGERTPEPRKEETQPAPERRQPETRTPETRREPTQRAEPRREPETQPAPRAEPSPRTTERSRTTERTTERTRTSNQGRTTDRAPSRTSERTTDRSSGRERVTRSTDARGETSRVTSRDRGNRGGQVVRPARRASQRATRNYRHVERRRYTWQHLGPVPHGGYRYRPAAPIIILDFDWPWEYRARRAWSPRYRYRQVVTIDAGYGGRYWDSRLDVRTTYRQRVRHATGREALLDLDIESIELYQDGRYLGRVTRIPEYLSRVQARVHRNGRITFDRDVFVVGSREVGFELVATSRYDGYVLSDWRRGDDFDVARLDLRRNRVQRVRESRFFDPYGYSGYAPVSVLPEDERWLGDYGAYAPSTYAYDDDFYDDYGYDDTYYYGAERGEPSYRFDENSALTLQGNSEDTFETVSGAQIRIRREAEIQRIE